MVDTSSTKFATLSCRVRRAPLAARAPLINVQLVAALLPPRVRFPQLHHVACQRCSEEHGGLRGQPTCLAGPCVPFCNSPKQNPASQPAAACLASLRGPIPCRASQRRRRRLRAATFPRRHRRVHLQQQRCQSMRLPRCPQTHGTPASLPGLRQQQQRRQSSMDYRGPACQRMKTWGRVRGGCNAVQDESTLKGDRCAEGGGGETQGEQGTGKRGPGEARQGAIGSQPHLPGKGTSEQRQSGTRWEGAAGPQRAGQGKWSEPTGAQGKQARDRLWDGFQADSKDPGAAPQLSGRVAASATGKRLRWAPHVGS